MVEVPVSAGETHDVWVNAVGGKGDGIVRVKGFVLFVPGVKKGDFVRIKITKVLEKVGFAELVEKLEKPVRKSKFTQVLVDDLKQEEEDPGPHIEDTEDFGEDLDEE